MTSKVELSAVIRINSTFSGEDAKERTMEIIRKIRAQADRMMKESGITAVNMDYTISWGEGSSSL